MAEITEAIALNGSFFSAQRMVTQDLQNACLPADRSGERDDRWATKDKCL